MQTRKRLLKLSALCCMLLLTSCNKDEEIDGATFDVVDATLDWSGNPAADGCGFTLTVGENKHKPINESDIADSYKEDAPLVVEVKLLNYHRTVRACQTGINMTSIKILDIKRKQ